MGSNSTPHAPSRCSPLTRFHGIRTRTLACPNHVTSSFPVLLPSSASATHDGSTTSTGGSLRSSHSAPAFGPANSELSYALFAVLFSAQIASSSSSGSSSESGSTANGDRSSLPRLDNAGDFDALDGAGAMAAPFWYASQASFSDGERYDFQGFWKYVGFVSVVERATRAAGTW